MTPRPDKRVARAFEDAPKVLPIGDIRPLRSVGENVRKSRKYNQIAASIREVGVIEPPVVARDRSGKSKYLLLDGHLRVEILKELGQTEVACLIATDDEAFTYNKRLNRLAIIQEHRMILKALERGVSEERIARTLNVDVGSIARKRRLLEGICEEAVDILKDRHMAIHVFTELRKLAPIRQIEAAELMVAMNKFTIGYARSLVAATPDSKLAPGRRRRRSRAISDEQLSLMQRESASLEREVKMVEQSYGADHLDLVLAKGYLAKLLENIRVRRYLSANQPELLGEFEKLTAKEPLAA